MALAMLVCRRVYHLESRWLATPMYGFIIAPYKSPPFWEWLAIYFHYGVYQNSFKQPQGREAFCWGNSFRSGG